MINNDMQQYWNKCLSLKKNDIASFNACALFAFRYQYENVPVYQQYVDLINVKVVDVKDYTQIPFLPISTFRTHTVLSQSFKSKDLLQFKSSGTTGAHTSTHFVADEQLYISSFLHTFQLFFGAPSDYAFLCLLPNYLEQGNSSLVYMCQELITQSQQEESGFYLYEWEQLCESIVALQKRGAQVVLIGVTYALLDFAEAYPIDMDRVIVIETGGMKGRKEEWTRSQVHQYLKLKWNLKKIYSEYGMTELLSQAYSLGDESYQVPSFLKVLLREASDPFQIMNQGSGLVNVIDLANIYSCSFIATDDIGRLRADGVFEILGRRDSSILRGCSLMAV